MHRSLVVGLALLLGSAVTLRAGGRPAIQTTQTKPAPTASAKKFAWPPAVEAAFKKAYPNATVKTVSKETENGKVQYEVESMDGTQARDLVYLADGTVVLYEELIPESAVPAAVVTAINAKYPKAILSRCEKLFQGGTMNYEFALKGATVSEVILTPEGKWVSPKK
jgi:hypothetical protein